MFALTRVSSTSIADIEQEIRARYDKPAVTIVHNMPRVMNTFSAASSFNATGNPHAWNAPACNPKLSAALEKLITESLIDLIPNDKALVPHEDAQVGPNDWDGSFGLQKGLKTIKLGSGREIKADFVFVGIGNRSNTELVEHADDAAIVDGQIWVDDYLRVSRSSPPALMPGGWLTSWQVRSSHPLSQLSQNYYAIGDCCSTAGWKTIQGAQYDAAHAALK